MGSLVTTCFAKPFKTYDVLVRSLNMLTSPVFYYDKATCEHGPVDINQVKRENNLCQFAVVELTYVPSGVILLGKLKGPLFLLLHGRVDKSAYVVNPAPTKGDLFRNPFAHYPAGWVLSPMRYIDQLSRCRFSPIFVRNAYSQGSFQQVLLPLLSSLEKHGPDKFNGEELFPLVHDGAGGMNLQLRYDWLVRCYKGFGINKDLHWVIGVFENENSLVKGMDLLVTTMQGSKYRVNRVYFKKLNVVELQLLVRFYKVIVPIDMWSYKCLDD